MTLRAAPSTASRRVWTLLEQVRDLLASRAELLRRAELLGTLGNRAAAVLLSLTAEQLTAAARVMLREVTAELEQLPAGNRTPEALDTLRSFEAEL